MPPKDPSQLLADSKWMRALAGSLIYGDGSVLDDLVQETWVVALEKRIAPTRSWTRAVMRNLVRLRFRCQARRREREVFSHEEREVPTPDELSARMDMQRRMAEAVLRLREPYREAVLLRFNEEMQPQEISRHLGIAPGTARSRLKRGLDLLREDFDSRHGEDGRSWAGSLLPLSQGNRGLGVPGLSISSAVATVVVAAALALVVSARVLSGVEGRDAEPPTAQMIPTDGSEPLANSIEQDSQSNRVEVRDELLVAATPQPELRKIRGVAFDSQGSPLGGVGIGLVGSRLSGPKPSVPVGRTKGDGTFEVEVPRASGVLRIEDEHWTSLFDSTLWAEMTNREAVLVAASPVSISLQVHDESGGAIAPATLRYVLPPNFRKTFTRPLATANRFDGIAYSDAHGRVRCEGLPWIPGAQLLVSATGFKTTRLALERAGMHELPVQLERLPTGSRDLSGWVLDPAGQGLERAWICIGSRTVRTGSDGSFRFMNMEADAGTKVFCSATNFAATATRLQEEHFDQELVLRLEKPAKSLSGRVTNGQGEAQVGARLWLADPMFVGRDPASGAPLYAESVSVQGRPFPWQEVQTDATGRFVLNGLSDRDYGLIALGPEGVIHEVSGPWPAGATDVEIVLERDPIKPLSGIVQDTEGRPVAGVSMWLERTVIDFSYESESRVEDPNTEESVRVQNPVDGKVVVMEEQASSLRRVVGELVHTDANGAFRFENFSGRGEWYLRAWMPGRMQMEWLLDDQELGAPSGARAWTIPEERPFRVERSADGVAFDSYYALTAAEERVPMVRSDGDILIFLLRGSFDGVQSAVYAISERAQTLVFELEGSEVGRLPLNLIAGQTVTVGF